MTGPDIQNLSQESLNEQTFPGSVESPFRLFLAPDVHRGIAEHAAEDTSVEICGVLVGGWARDKNGPFANVAEYIRCQQAASKFAEVTFTHESWAQINQEMDGKYADLRIVGWYHSHPDFGIFLSDRDIFIHEHFFSAPGQVAYVVDPVRQLEGVFAWKEGKPEPLSIYWVGEQIRTVEASRSKPSANVGDSPAVSTSRAPTVAHPNKTWDTVTMVLTWVLLFLVGYLLAGMKSRWEQNMIVEGAVAHYGVEKMMKLGFSEDLREVRNTLEVLTRELRSLPAQNSELSKKELDILSQKRRAIEATLLNCAQALDVITEKYDLSEEEMSALARLVAQKNAALRNAAPDAAAPKKMKGVDFHEPNTPQTTGDVPTAKKR